MAAVRLSRLRKSYDGHTDVLAGIDLDIANGEFVVLVGPSGCGKSTLLRMICGLEGITDGTLEIDGQVVSAVVRTTALVVVEASRYWDAAGLRWGAGVNVLGTPWGQ